MADIPVERRAYFPLPPPDPRQSRTCSVCGRPAMTPWYLRRDRTRHVFRRWVCLNCQAYEDVPEEESA